MKLYLIVAKGKQQGQPIRIDSELFMMGSDKMCQLRSQLPGIGRQHCIITNRDRKVFIRDLGSGEKTVINGELLPPDSAWPLHASDRVEVGPLEFMVQFSERALSKRDLEEWALRCLDEHERGHGLTEELELMSRKETAVNASKAAEAIIDRLNAQRGLVKGRLRIGLELGVTVVRINDAQLVDDEELALIDKEIRENLSRANLRVLLDLKNVRRCSTKAVQMIGNLAPWLQSWGSTFAVCRIQPDLKDTLLSLPQLRGIKVYPDKPTALANRW
jgi:pSer/pThr/pTyr-binding forkhead associated (FHA) protein/anti-anti-sigma regulatory factor